MGQVLSSFRVLDGIQEEYCPGGVPLAVVILSCDMKIIQQFDKYPYCYPLESPVTDELDSAYNKSPQPRGEGHPVVKVNEVPWEDTK